MKVIYFTRFMASKAYLLGFTAWLCIGGLWTFIAFHGLIGLIAFSLHLDSYYSFKVFIIGH